MSQLVRIAPGVVFSADVLGTDWARKYQQISVSEVPNGNAQSAIRRGRPAKEADQAIRESTSIQMPLLWTTADQPLCSPASHREDHAAHVHCSTSRSSPSNSPKKSRCPGSGAGGRRAARGRGWPALFNVRAIA